MICNVTALNNKLVDDSVEGRLRVGQAIALAGTELAEAGKAGQQAESGGSSGRFTSQPYGGCDLRRALQLDGLPAECQWRRQGSSVGGRDGWPCCVYGSSEWLRSGARR